MFCMCVCVHSQSIHTPNLNNVHLSLKIYMIFTNMFVEFRLKEMKMQPKHSVDRFELRLLSRLNMPEWREQEKEKHRERERTRETNTKKASHIKLVWELQHKICLVFCACFLMLKPHYLETPRLWKRKTKHHRRPNYWGIPNCIIEQWLLFDLIEISLIFLWLAPFVVEIYPVFWPWHSQLPVNVFRLAMMLRF